MPPVIIAAVISAGAGVYAAHEASKGNTEAAKTNATAADEAAKLQAETADKALAQAKDIYQQQRADESGYRSIGNNALGAASFGLGLPAPSFSSGPMDAASAPTPTNLPTSNIQGLSFPGSPQVAPETTSQLNTLSNAGGVTGPVWDQVNQKVQQAQQSANQKFAGTGPTTRIKAPNGLVYLVPNDKVDAATQAGGTRV